jgi:signal transduction histidine kinase
MKLRPRLFGVALLVAIPAAVLVFMTAGWLHARDMREAMDRFITSQLTDDTRERCDTNPNWFLAGPRPDRPTAQQLSAPDADVTAPRPSTQELPFDFFAYDSAYQPLSTAGPRFPSDMRQTLRSGAKRAEASFETKEGTGFQEAVLTEWPGSSCAVLLFRMRALPSQGAAHAGFFALLLALLFVVALVPAYPVVARVRRLGVEARRAAEDEYRSTISVGGRDEMSSIAFAFNEAGSDIRRRATDTRDREESLRRYISSIEENVALPLGLLETHLDDTRHAAPDAIRAEIDALTVEAHSLGMRLQNLSVAAALKMTMDARTQNTIDLNALVARVVDRQAAFARAEAVQIDVAPTTEPLTMTGNVLLLEQAVNNLVDNAIRHNRAGGHVTISIDRTSDGRVSLRVEDDGPGAPDDVLAKLNANRRFRGDEGRAHQTGELGLGLAVVREVSDRLGIRWAFRRSARGWFQAELTK